MCGIILTENNKRVDLIKHRGIFQRVLGPVHDKYIGHVHLPIQVDSHGVFPAIVGEYYLLYNGELFNCPGFDNDVDYIIDFFSRYNSFDSIISPPALQEMNGWDGFWSIILYRVDGSDTIFFTDPLGKKQLYYNNNFDICSEIYPLLNSESGFDPIYKSQVYKWGYSIGDRTPFDNINRVIPNRIYYIRDGLITYMDKYYNLFTRVDLGIKQYLSSAVYNRIISNKHRIALLLSGGLDSTIILDCINNIPGAGNGFRFFHVNNDESDYAEVCQKHYNINIEYIDIDSVSDSVYIKNEGPVDLGSVLPQHALFSAISRYDKNIRVVMSGDGADELFGGYRRITDYDSQGSDVFDELSYYHLPRLDRASMSYTIELRSPFLSHDVIRFAINTPYSSRINKSILKDTFMSIPEPVRARIKKPLKTTHAAADKIKHRHHCIDLFYSLFDWGVYADF